jgi:hypothetical protein
MKSDLPNASQFSPVQTPLPKLLQIVQTYAPDRKAVSQAILAAFFSGRGERTTWDWKLADKGQVHKVLYFPPRLIIS